MTPRRCHARVPGMRRPRDAWASKLLHEATMLNALGYLDADGNIVCPQCSGHADRLDGWTMIVVCACGWRIEDL